MPPPPKHKHVLVTTVLNSYLFNSSWVCMCVCLLLIVPLSTPSNDLVDYYQQACEPAKTWINKHSFFCFTLAASPFIKNQTELKAREERAINMFCHMDFILNKIDCAQPYSVNVHRKQCQMCREAYRDWVCAMVSDTLEDGRLDCYGGVMPCVSCASICHQVMRLCPYLTPDRVQYEESGEASSHVSQYGGHPAFYCPLEDTEATDPYSKCEYMGDSSEDTDYVHNLCADPLTVYSSRKRSILSTYRTYKSCCWTYAYSLLDYYSSQFDKTREENNRVILNCCDEFGVCTASDPVYNSTTRTANNQIIDKHGHFTNQFNNDQYYDDDEEDHDIQSGYQSIILDKPRDNNIHYQKKFIFDNEIFFNGSPKLFISSISLAFNLFFLLLTSF